MLQNNVIMGSLRISELRNSPVNNTVYPKKYAHGFCFAVLCCGYTLTDFPISIRLTSLALWQSNDCPSASKATLMNMDKYFMWIHYERLHNHNKAKHNKTVCILPGIYCMFKAVCKHDMDNLVRKYVIRHELDKLVSNMNENMVKQIVWEHENNRCEVTCLMYPELRSYNDSVITVMS